MNRALFVLCALLCLFVLSARSELNVPWPPSSPPTCSSTWQFEGEAYAFCHMDFTGSTNDNEWDGETVSEIIEPCNFHYFKIDAETYSGGLQVGDWLEVFFEYDTTNGTGTELTVFGRYEALPTEADYDFVFTANYNNVTFSISPYYVSLHASSTIWLAVGNFVRHDDTTDPADYSLTVIRYRPSRDCGDCVCDPTFGYDEITVSTSGATGNLVASGTFLSDFNDTRPELIGADPNYQRLRNFHFNVPSSLYHPGAYLDINVTVLNGTAALENSYISLGPYAVDPYTTAAQDNHKANGYFAATGTLDLWPCVNGDVVPGQTNHLIVPPCNFYYGDYYLSLLFVNSGCIDGATYEITVNVFAPIVNQLSVNVPFTNNLQDNIFLGAQASYSQFDHYVLDVTGTTGRTHAFARLSSVYGAQLGLFMRVADQTDNNIAFGNNDKTLVPYVWEYQDVAADCEDCYTAYEWRCETGSQEELRAEGDSYCGCYFIVPSCAFTDQTYYLSVVPGYHDGDYYVDGNSYHLEVNTYEDSLSVALAPGVPVVATLAVWTPFQAYTFATPNAVDTWAVVELFVRAPSTSNNQLAQPSLTLSLQQGYSPYDSCTQDDDYYKTCSTSGYFFAGGSDDGYSLSYPSSCNIFVDTCRLNSGPIYLVVYNDDSYDDLAPFGVIGGQWDYVLWADLENPWALESDVTYTDRLHGNFYNHYYIDVDDSIEAGSWLSVDFENIVWLQDDTSVSFAAFLNYESLAGECPCYEYVDVCQVENYVSDAADCTGDDACPTDVNGWEPEYNFDLPDNTYPVPSSFDTNNLNSASCRVQASVCTFRPGRWYVSTKAAGCKSEPASEGKYLIGYTVTAHIYDAPVVNELEFNEQITEQLVGSEIRHYQLTSLDAAGEDLVITVAWYEEVLSRFYLAFTDFTGTLPKSYVENWGIEVRLNFGDLAFEECYEHPWSCKASFTNGGSCQIIVPVCKWAFVDPEQIFISARFNRGLNESDEEVYVSDQLSGFGTDPIDVLAAEFWAGGAAQFNLLVSSERPEVTALAVNVPVYGSVKKDRYAHYSLQLLQTQGLRTNIDIYYNVQTAYDLSFEGAEAYYPVLALNQGSLAGDARGCRDCFTAARTCQNNAACHWTFDSCDGLDIDTTYYLSVYKPANAFYDQALEFALTVSQEDLIIPVALTSEGRLTSTIKLQDQQSTRAFFEIDGSSLTPRQSPYDALYITVWANGAYDAAFTAYLNHDGLAGACPCFGRICQQDFNLTTECPIAYHDDSDTEYRGALVDYNLEAGSYFVTLEFPAAHGSDAAVITIEADVIYYPVFDITPTNLRESGPEFWLGDFDLPYGELLGDTTSADDADYNAGFNMDNWLIDNAGNIDWDLSNLFRNHVLNPRNFVQRYRITPPSRLDDLNWQNLNFYAVSIDSRNTVPGFPMPNRVYVGIDNIHGDHDNCDSLRSLSLSWYGTNNGETDRAVNPFLTSTVVDESRTTCSNYEDIDDYIATFIARTSNGLLFTELPPCLFTHAGEAVHYFGVRSNGFLGWDVELSDSDTATLRGSVFYDIRFWIQKPIVLENIASFYTGANFVSEVVNAPYATNWQTFRYGSSAYNANEFKQRFELDLTAEIAGMDAPFVQVVIEHEFAELTVTANADYPPNFNFDSDGCIDECNLRSVLEVRLNSLSAVQLPNVVVEGDAYFSDRASNSMNYLLPDSDVHYYSSANNGTFVFTLDPCALRQSANWFFDIISQDSNTSFFVYYTDPIDLLDANVVDITVADVEQRDWVPNSGDSVLLENLDDYSFLRLSIDDLNLFAAGLGRPRLEIQIDWLPQFDTDVLGLDQAAAIWITREEPLFLKGESASFPFNVQDNFAVPSDEFFIDSDFDDYDSYVDVCSDAFYMSSIGPDYNTTNFPARLGERFFLDGCDLAGTSEIWITARMLTAGYHDFQVLARVVADTIGTTNIPIADGYPDVAQVNIQSDTADAIEPFSFNHHSFVLPADLQNDADVQSTLIVELKFPDDDIDRYNGTFYLLFSTDAPAGFTGSLTPDNYEAVFDSRYPSIEYGGLLTFGEQAGYNPFGSDNTALNDCYTNLIDYQSSELTFDDDDTGIVPVGDFITEYRTRRNIDLYNFRYASTLWVSVFFQAPVWEELDPQEEDDVLGWQGYELRVWIQSEPATVPIAIERNITAADICWEVATDTGVDANTFDYNITWGVKSLTPTWFAFELTNDLVSLDCSDLDTADTECLFSQWLEFSIYNDWETSGGVVQDYTYSTGGNDFPELYVLDTYTVIGPARFSVGGTGDMYTSSSGNDIVAGEWTIHDSHLSSDRHLGAYQALIAVNDSYTPPRFYPCSGAGGAGYGVDEDWVFNAEFVTPTATLSLRPGIYYIPVWSADSIDFTICASLNSFGYDTLWTDPASPYIPTEIDIDENGDDEEDVSVLAQILNVPVDRSDDPTSYEYYWFHLDDSEFDERDYLQIWLDQVLFCSSPSSCSSIASDDTIILQMFRSDCQLWTCQADGEGAGCEGRYEIGSPDDVNADFFYDDVSRFVLGGAGLSPCSLTAGSFFIKVSLPSNATYSLSVYLRSPPATFALPDAVAIRSTIFQSAFQHYSYTSSDSATALLSRIDVSLTEVACGHLELFAKHGTPAGPFFPTTLDRTTFIGSQMYNPTNVAGALFGSGQYTRFIGSSLEKCASAYCATSDSDDSCTIQLGTTELSKNLDAAGSLGSTTWFFAVRVIESNYTTDNDEADVFTGTPSSTVYGVGFFEPVTFFITAESFYTEVTANVQWGCSTSLTTDSDECADEEPSDDNTIPSIQFGFQTIGLFTDAYITTDDGESNSFVLLNATVVDLDKPDGVNQFVEPVWQIGDYGEWGRFVSNWAYITTDLSNYNSNDKPSGPQNIFVNVVDAASIFADFYHNPVPLIAPGVVYPGAGHDSDINPDDGPRFISSRYVFYEFSPALSSSPLFSLTTNADNGVPSCFAPRFWWSEDCGAFSPSSPNTESFFYSCGSDLPRFLSFRLEDCSASCSTLSCTDAFQWELSYQTSLPFTDLQLNVESCGAEWEAVQFTESLSADSTEYVLFSLPVDVDPSTPTQVSWLSLDFYPSLNDEIYDNDIWLFESSDLTCSGYFSDEQEGYFDHQNSFVCPQFSYMVVDTSSFLLDYSASAITATNFQFDVIDAGELTTASPGSELSITVTFADFTQFDLFYYYAVYSFTIPDSLVPIASELSIDVESDYCASSYNWWINYEVPLPPACDDLNDEITDCSLLPGTYFVSLQLSPYASDEAVPEFTSTIIVTLDTFDVLSVPEGGSFSETFTLEPFETVILQTEFSPEWLTSHPALQSEALYRFISPLGLPTQAPVFASLAECFDCSSPVFWTKFTNEYETPFDVTIQFELMSDLLLNFDPSVATVGFPITYWGVNFDVTNVQAPLMFLSSYQGILAPYFDDRALTINPLSLGTSVDGSLYNAFTYRQLQVYLVSTVAANAIGQIRVSDVTGGLVSLQVFPATLDRSCGEFKECHSAPLHWSDDHGLLQANPLNNIAGSCSLVYSPCEWAAYPSYFVVVHDHVFNAVDEGASLNVYDTPYGSGPYDGFEIGYSNDNSTDYEYQTIGCSGFGCHQVTPTQDNPFVSTKFTLTATEEFYHTESFPTATQSFSSRPSPSERSLDNPAGNWQHFFYSYEASGVSSIVISVDVTSASALATSGVYVTVSDSDCGCSDFVRNIWCSAEYPSWLCEIEIPTHADHPLSSSTFYIDVYGLKGSFSLDVSEGLDNCVWSDGEDFCPTRVLNYAFWPTVPSSELDGKASCLYEELLTYFEDPACNDCLYDIPDECKVALQDYACAATFNPCDVDGFIDATICVDKCTAVEEACPYTFIEAGLVNLNCGHPRYSSTNCFE